MSIGIVKGKEKREYADKDTGERKTYRAVHIEWLDKKKDGLTGKAVEVLSVPKEVDFESILLDQTYEVMFGAYGRYARLEGFKVCKP